MSDTGKQSPLGVNTLSSLLQNIGFNINPIMVDFTGVSEDVPTATNLGKIVNDTCLRLLTYAINDAYTRGLVNSTTYKNLITIGSTTIPALGNTPPSTYNWSGYPAWAPQWGTSPSTRAITQWGYVRLFALQGYNEFNYNDSETSGQYKDFLSGIMSADAFITYTNQAIMAVYNSQDFLDGVYSNMNDLLTADITGVSLSTQVFGQDLMATGKAIDLSQLDTFGLPSNLLKTLVKNNALTKNLNLAIISSGILANELEDILNNVSQPTIEQERNLYACFYLTVGDALTEVLTPLNCKTRGLESVADLLNPQKLFPNSYQTLTVPVYNTQNNLPTNSKTYYPIYSSSQSINPNLSSSQVVSQIGTQIPIGTPAVAEKQITVYQYTMTDEQGNPIDLVATQVRAAALLDNIISGGDSGGDGGGAGGGAGGGGAGGGGGGGAM
jgi:uncharacterized membrane protein YgcG